MHEEDARRLLQQARLFINGRQAGAALPLIDRVLKGYQGPQLTQEALNLERQVRRILDTIRPPVRISPTLRNLKERWQEIHRLWEEPRIFYFLDDMVQHPEIWPQFQDDFVGKMRHLLQETIQRLQERQPTFPLRFVPFILEKIRQMQIYEVQLEAELETLRDISFAAEFGMKREEIDTALNNWELDQANNLFNQLSPQVPVRLQADYDALRQRLEAIVERHEKVKEDLAAWEKLTLMEWPQIRVALEVGHRLASYEQDGAFPMPPAFREQISRLRERIVPLIEGFLCRQAAEIDDLAGIQGFFREYELPEASPAISAEWFKKALEKIKTGLTLKTKAAGSPKELLELANRVALDTRSLPEFLVQETSCLRDGLVGLANAWLAMRSGKKFSLPTDWEAPRVMEEERKTYQCHLGVLEEARSWLERQPPEPDLLGKALEIAREVLQACPDHQFAKGLEQKALTARAHFRVHEALRRWDISSFLDLCKDREIKAPYGELAHHRKHLMELASLSGQGELKSHPDAAAWWYNWRTVWARLQPKLFDFGLEILKNPRQEEEERRQGQWLKLLEEAVAGRHTPEECETLAAFLQEEKEANQTFASYYKILHRKALVGRVEWFISKGDLAAADTSLQELDEHADDFLRLKTLLDLKQAQATGVARLAEVLHQKWRLLVYVGQEAFELIREALREAWEQEMYEVLPLLEKVGRQILDKDKGRLSPEMREEIGDWVAWLRLEKALMTEQVANAEIKGLMDYVESHLNHLGRLAPILRQRLVRLVQRWLKGSKLVLMAWSYRVFHILQPPVWEGGDDPLDRLFEASQQAETRVSKELETRENLSLKEIQCFRDVLQREEKRWHTLGNLLAQGGLPLDRPPPPRLRETSVLLDKVIQVHMDLDNLGQADLRTEGNRRLLETCRLVLKLNIEPLPLKDGLWAEWNRLEPLSRLKLVEGQLMSAAAQCGSPAVQDLDTPGVFRNLEGRIRDLSAPFVVAKAKGGPMWQTVSHEYWKKVLDLTAFKADSAAPLLSGLDHHSLDDLATLAGRLQAEEDRLITGMQALSDSQPVVGDRFIPLNHRTYLDLLAEVLKHPPATRRLEFFFERFAYQAQRRKILTQSLNCLPDWLLEWVTHNLTPRR